MRPTWSALRPTATARSVVRSTGGPSELTSPCSGAEPDGFRLLSHLLAELNAHSGSRLDTAVDTGRQSGLERIAVRSGRDVGRQEEGEAAGREACLQVVLDELSELGFDPTVGAVPLDSDVVAISFQRCPFREIAVLYPDLVCQLHRGLTEGILEGVCAVAPELQARVKSFSSLVDADPCWVGVSIGV